MPFLHHGSLAFAALASVRRTQQCFDLSANGCDEEALQLLARTRARTANNPYAPWDIELQLLQSYLQLEAGQLQQARRTLRGAFRRIKASSYNGHEKAFSYDTGSASLSAFVPMSPNGWSGHSAKQPGGHGRTDQQHQSHDAVAHGAEGNLVEAARG